MRRIRSYTATALVFLGLLCWSGTLFLILRSDHSAASNINPEQLSRKREDGKTNGKVGRTDPRLAEEVESLRVNGQQSVAGSREVTRGAMQSSQVSYIRLEGVDTPGNTYGTGSGLRACHFWTLNKDLFMVHGADTPTLKALCSALDQCAGFNSEGWIKGHIVEKKRSHLDLYLKQTIVKPLVSRRPGNTSATPLEVDASAGIFMDHLADYSRMEKQFKIYMYHSSIGRQYPSHRDYKYGVEDLFQQLLASSRFRTEDPEEADFFFIPSRCTAYRKSVSSLQLGIERAAEVVRDMVHQISHDYPYWNQSLGSDHFYVCSHDMGTEVVKLSVPELGKNSIGLVNTAEYSEQYFVPHKDISVPPHPGRGVLDWSTVGQGGQNSDPLKRTKLAFLAGNFKRGVRPRIYQLFEDDPDFNLVKGRLEDHDYFKALLSSKYCLCPRGNKGWSPRVLDAVWFGCVPVFLADHYEPPLTQLIPWQEMSLTIPEAQVGSLKVILQAVPDERLTYMQQKIAQLYHHLTWHKPPRPYDAFHGVLFQLWQRRNVHRTKPLSLL